MKLREPVRVEKKKSNRQVKREKLKEEINILYSELDKLIKQKDSLPERKIIGMSVLHKKKYGKGVILSEKDGRISIEFNSGIKPFKIPDSFIDGFLTSEYDDFMDIYNEGMRLDAEILKLEDVIEDKESQLAQISI